MLMSINREQARPCILAPRSAFSLHAQLTLLPALSGCFLCRPAQWSILLT